MISATEQQALLNTIRLIAADIGRLRRVTPEDTSAWWALDRIASNVEGLDNILQPSAGELYREYVLVCGDHDDIAVTEALRVVDARVRSLRELLGVKADTNGMTTLRAVA